MLIDTLPIKDPVHKYQKCIVVLFTGKRRVLSTCQLNGGYQEGLTAVFNNDIKPGEGMECRLLAPTYEEHLKLTAESLGLDPCTSAGMSTAANMDHAAIRTERCGALAVTAVVTGGIDVNGGRVGDPASWDELEDASVPVKAGTINIMLFMNTDLTPGALARAMVTCTEAKTAVLQELLAPSRYSMGIATGSGTDSTIVVCNAESEICLTDAGKHSKLGELVGRAVKAAVREALYRETGLSPESQHHVMKRLDRFGITEETLWEEFRKKIPGTGRADFSERLYQIGRDGEMVAAVSLYVHLLDQLLWGMLSAGEAHEMGRKLLVMMGAATESRTEPEAQDMVTQMIRELKEALNDLAASWKIRTEPDLQADCFQSPQN